MINQTEPYADETRGNLLNSIPPIIIIILLIAIIFIQIFKNSSVNVDSTPPIVNLTVMPAEVNPIINHNITIMNNMTGFGYPFGNWTYPFNSTNQTNYFGNYTINNTLINNTYNNFTYYNYTLNDSRWLLNLTKQTYICDLQIPFNSTHNYTTWCWV